MADCVPRKMRPEHTYCLRCDADMVMPEETPHPIDPKAKRVTMVLLSGRQSTWSFCRDCEPPQDGAEIRHFHARLLRAMEVEGGTPTIRQLFAADVPFGALHVQRWGKVS